MTKHSEELPGTELFPGNQKKALESATKSNLWMVPVEDIQIIEDFNVRIWNDAYKEHINDIAKSILENGFKMDKPLSATVMSDSNGNDVIKVTDGHTRLAATKLAISWGAPIEKLPVVIEENSNMVDFTVSLISSNSGRPLTSYEKALVCKRLAQYNLDRSEISKKTGIHQNLIVNYLTHLMPSPPQIHEWIKEDRISVDFAVEMIKKHKGKSVQKIREAIERAEKKGDKKATKAHLPDAQFKTFIKKKGGDMAELLTRINFNEKIMGAISEIDPDAAEVLRKLANESGEALDAMLCTPSEEEEK